MFLKVIIFKLFCFSQVTFTTERIEYLKGLSAMPDIYERLSTALGKQIFLAIFVYEAIYFYDK